MTEDRNYYYPRPIKYRILHHWTREDIDKFCKQAEKKGERVMVTIYSYKKEIYSHFYDDENGNRTFEDREEDVLTGGWGYQIHSSKDLFQFDIDEDIHILRKDIKEELR